jgi:hypothetical protein
MGDHPAKPVAQPESSYVLAARDYADVAHLENPSVIERILSRSRSEATAYVGALVQSGVTRYVLAGPKVAFTAMVIEAITDLSREISVWRKLGRIPEDFSGRPSGYQTWVELLVEIDSNPTDSDRLKALKAMFLAANRVDATEGESIVAYQLFQVAKKLNSGELLLLRTIYAAFTANTFPRGTSSNIQQWAEGIAARMGHQLSALVLLDERMLVDQGLISPRINNPGLEAVREGATARLTDLGIRFCQNVETYRGEPTPPQQTP